jgi:hypothetical protein
MILSSAGLIDAPNALIILFTAVSHPLAIQEHAFWRGAIGPARMRHIVATPKYMTVRGAGNFVVVL